MSTKVVKRWVLPSFWIGFLRINQTGQVRARIQENKETRPLVTILFFWWIWHVKKTRRWSFHFYLFGIPWNVFARFLSCCEHKGFLSSQQNFQINIYNASTGIWRLFLVQCTGLKETRLVFTDRELFLLVRKTNTRWLCILLGPLSTRCVLPVRLGTVQFVSFWYNSLTFWCDGTSVSSTIPFASETPRTNMCFADLPHF